MRECGELVPAEPARVDGRGPRPASLPGGSPRRGRAGPPAGRLPRGADPAGVPGRALLRGDPGALADDARGILRAPGGPGPIGLAARRRHAWPRGAAHRLHPRRVRVRVGVPRPGRGARRGLLHRPGHGAPGLDGHHFAATRKAFETPFGPLEVDREILDAVVRRVAGRISSRPSSPTVESTPSSSRRSGSEYLRHRAGGGARRIVPLLASFVHECLVAGGEPRRRSPTSARCSTPCPGRDGHRSAALLHRGGRGSRPRGPAVRGRVARGTDPAGARPVRGSRAARAGGPRGTPKDSSGRRSASGTGTGSAACRRSTPSFGCCPGAEGTLLHYGQWPDPDGAVTFASVTSSRRGRLDDPAAPARARRSRGRGPLGSLPDRPRGRLAARGRRGHPSGRPAEPLREPPGRRRAATTSRRGRSASRCRWTTRPFVVVRARAGDPRAIELHLSDGSREPLDPATLVSTRAAFPYCRVKGGQFRARLSVAAWLQLAGRIETDPGSGARRPGPGRPPDSARPGDRLGRRRREPGHGARAPGAERPRG